MMTEMELVKRMGGGEGRGDASERSIKLRMPATKGSKEDTARLKSTRQAKTRCQGVDAVVRTDSAYHCE